LRSIFNAVERPLLERNSANQEVLRSAGPTLKRRDKLPDPVLLLAVAANISQQLGQTFYIDAYAALTSPGPRCKTTIL
jgi:hypothetical protein